MSTTTDTSTIESKGIRNFRTAADIENFYRFIQDNGLRREASLVLSAIVGNLRQKEKKETRKKKAKARRKEKLQ
ncbi:hypothetical protein BIY24_12875 [Halobacteriovorax marinus]|uniref:Uncharacterized protein n=1 Tax=Halobacteriovorax marinus (strain ATCC BAA-682 / DSM 15412 / SJ) TaxID=862908 RepID=E1WXJ0_HALMS|nr:hypothetical protein [Halobacteriovorax marinus]ATH08808.1 hypothetical protein BIY24_12875 [Halobacteriovorax marinus]CBW27507.1 hypothetical protein BMS_2730 [Halobacteriovorax marinus SJ]